MVNASPLTAPFTGVSIIPMDINELNIWFYRIIEITIYGVEERGHVLASTLHITTVRPIVVEINTEEKK